MNYCIMCVGKMKDSFYRQHIKDICQDISCRQNRIEIMEFADEKILKRMSPKEREIILEREGQRILEKIEKGSYIIALCIEGREITTRQHAELIRKAMETGYHKVVYLIGGSLGLSDKVKQKADKKISFSKMTFPHQLMRMVLCEEIRNMMDYL